MKLLLGIDVGTSGTKSALFDTSGNIVCLAFSEYSIDQPRNGWVQQHPDLWWNAVIESVRTLLTQVGSGEIISVSLSYVMFKSSP